MFVFKDWYVIHEAELERARIFCREPMEKIVLGAKSFAINLKI